MSKIIKVIPSEVQEVIKKSHGSQKVCPVCFSKAIPSGVKSCKACKPKPVQQVVPKQVSVEIPVVIFDHIPGGKAVPISIPEWVEIKGKQIVEKFPEVEFDQIEVSVPIPVFEDGKVKVDIWDPKKESFVQKGVKFDPKQSKSPAIIPHVASKKDHICGIEFKESKVFEVKGIIGEVKGKQYSDDKIIDSAVIIVEGKPIPVKDVHIFKRPLSPEDKKVWSQIKVGDAVSVKVSPIVLKKGSSKVDVSFSGWHDIQIHE